MSDTINPIVEAISALINNNNINVSDIPEVSKNNSDINELINVANAMFSCIKDNIGENEAYTWALNTIGQKWLDKLDIKPPRLYRHAEVTIKLNVITPNNWNDDEIITYVFDRDLMSEDQADILVDVDSTDIKQDSVFAYEYINDVDTFNDSDFL